MSTDNQKKEHLNIGTIGHVDHGKTTLSAAISKYAAIFSNLKVKSYDQIDNAPEERARGVTINASTLEVETFIKHYALSDCPGHADYMKNMLVGVNKLDGVILVVSGTDSVMSQTKAHLQVASQTNIKKIIVVINKADIAEEDLLEMVESDIVQNLEEHQYEHVQVPDKIRDMSLDLKTDFSDCFEVNDKKEFVIVRGSALQALSETKDNATDIGYNFMISLLRLIDYFFPTPKRAYDEPFSLGIDGCYQITGRGVVITGKVNSGVLSLSQEVQIVGLGCNYKNVVTGIESFNKSQTQCRAGENVGILIRGLSMKDVKKGALCCALGAYQEGKMAKVSLFFDNDGKSRKSENRGVFMSGYKPQLYINTINVTVTIKFTDENWKEYENKNDKIVKPGDQNVNAIVYFDKPIALEPITSSQSSRVFVLREGVSNKATGRIIELMNV